VAVDGAVQVQLVAGSDAQTGRGSAIGDEVPLGTGGEDGCGVAEASGVEVGEPPGVRVAVATCCTTSSSPAGEATITAKALTAPSSARAGAAQRALFIVVPRLPD
jgi:hypothetical protein